MSQQGLCCHCLSHATPAMRTGSSLWECVLDPGKRRKRNWSELLSRPFFRELSPPLLSPSISQPQMTLHRPCHTELYSLSPASRGDRFLWAHPHRRKTEATGSSCGSSVHQSFSLPLCHTWKVLECRNHMAQPSWALVSSLLARP